MIKNDKFKIIGKVENDFDLMDLAEKLYQDGAISFGDNLDTLEQFEEDIAIDPQQYPALIIKLNRSNQFVVVSYTDLEMAKREIGFCVSTEFESWVREIIGELWRLLSSDKYIPLSKQHVKPRPLGRSGYKCSQGE